MPIFSNTLNIEFANRHVLVTGASQGIGRAVAFAFARRGARVSAVARNKRNLKNLCDEIESMGGKAIFAVCDLLLSDDVPTVIRSLESSSGPIDTIIHCVGASLGCRDVFASLADWHRVWHLNVGTAIEVNNAIVPGMIDRQFGRVVMISSRASRSLDGAPAYSAAKAYLDAYIRILGREIAGTGVIVSGISPGVINAEGNSWNTAIRDKPEDVKTFVKSNIPRGRIGNPDDLIPFILLLASEETDFAAGTIVPITGGEI